MFPEASAFKHKCSITIRFVDIDAFNHVNNAHYLTFAEQARMSYFQEVFEDSIDWKSKGLILANANIDYKAPVYLNDSIYIYIRCSAIGTKSFSMEYLLVHEESGKPPVLKALMKTVLVAYDYVNNRSIEVLEDWKNRINKYESLG